MVRMDVPRASLSREMCAFLKGVGCIVVSSLAVYLLLSGLSTTGAQEAVGYYAPVGYSVTTWEIEFVPSIIAEQKPDATEVPGQPMRVALPDPAAAGDVRRCVQPRIVMTADALIDAYATPLGSGRQLRGGHGGHGGGGRGHAGGARGTAHAARAHNGGVFVSRLAVGRRHMGRMVIFMVLAGRHAHQRYVWSSSAEKYLVELEPICWDGPRALLTVNITAVGPLDSLDQAFLDVSAVLPPEE